MPTSTCPPCSQETVISPPFEARPALPPTGRLKPTPATVANFTSVVEALKHTFEASWSASFHGMESMLIQRDKYAERLEVLKSNLEEAEAVATRKLEVEVEAAKVETGRGLMDMVNRMGREFVDSGYHLFRKRIQKLHLSLDISGVDDVEVEDSNPYFPEPIPVQPIEGTVIEDAVPITIVPPLAVD
ncbi:hypothetical protein F0562_017570 [Nyssa sinensis]|uniref:Uncharacterized protein n=1 Tax=Nyssa sinensis TaxID=561372 RepID=A0A5J4ZJ36_9ASTE|nr:hypothetical protein F0562_017570 [Nyssa sinensis]